MTVTTADAATADSRTAVPAATLHAVEQFLYDDADLLDRWLLHDWLANFAPEGRYVVPTNDLPSGNPEHDLVIVNDDRFLLEQRINSLLTRAAHAEYPHSRTRRLITNVRAWSRQDGALDVNANFAVFRMRPDVFDIYVGRYVIVLETQAEGGFRFQLRRAELDLDALRPQGKLSILL